MHDANFDWLKRCAATTLRELDIEIDFSFEGTNFWDSLSLCKGLKIFRLEKYTETTDHESKIIANIIVALKQFWLDTKTTYLL